MPRYVDVDKLPKNRGILDTGFTGKMPIRFIDMDDIEKAPTADVVEVVRCGKCRKRNTEECWCSQWEDDYETGFDENGFCSGGERKDT